MSAASTSPPAASATASATIGARMKQCPACTSRCAPCSWIGRAGAARLVAYYLALQRYSPSSSASSGDSSSERPLSWDQHLLAGAASARELTGGSASGLLSAAGAFVAAKLRGGLQKHPPRFSDLFFAAAGIASAFAALGLLAAGARQLPLVGPWHQAGLPLLLGSFGTLAILLFGKPEAEPVRLWPLVAGQLAATAIALAVLAACGPRLLSRAAAMAATVAVMMATDCVHPPGGALVLLAMDNAAVAQLHWAYLLWPSLALSLGVLLPISAATNWLRRSYQFDAPWSSGARRVASMQQKRAAWVASEPAGPAGPGGEPLSEGSAAPVRLASAVLGSLARLLQRLAGLGRLLALGGSEHAPGARQPGRLPLQRLGAGGGRPATARFSLDSRLGSTLGAGVDQAAAAQAAAAASLDATIRRRLRREEERQLEDGLHRRRIWGDEGLAEVERLEERLERLRRQHQKQRREEQQQQKQQHTRQQQRAVSPIGGRQQPQGEEAEDGFAPE